MAYYVIVYRIDTPIADDLVDCPTESIDSASEILSTYLGIARHLSTRLGSERPSMVFHRLILMFRNNSSGSSYYDTSKGLLKCSLIDI